MTVIVTLQLSIVHNYRHSIGQCSTTMGDQRLACTVCTVFFMINYFHELVASHLKFQEYRSLFHYLKPDILFQQSHILFVKFVKE